MRKQIALLRPWHLLATVRSLHSLANGHPEQEELDGSIPFTSILILFFGVAFQQPRGLNPSRLPNFRARGQTPSGEFPENVTLAPLFIRNKGRPFLTAPSYYCVFILGAL